MDYTFPQSSSGFPKLCSAKHEFRAVLPGLPWENCDDSKLNPICDHKQLGHLFGCRSFPTQQCVCYTPTQKDFPQSCLSRLIIRNKDGGTLWTAQLDTTQTGRQDVIKIVHVLVENFQYENKLPWSFYCKIYYFPHPFGIPSLDFNPTSVPWPHKPEDAARSALKHGSIYQTKHRLIYRVFHDFRA